MSKSMLGSLFHSVLRTFECKMLYEYVNVLVVTYGSCFSILIIKFYNNKITLEFIYMKDRANYPSHES